MSKIRLQLGYTIPTYYATALVYGDYSALTEEECDDLATFEAQVQEDMGLSEPQHITWEFSLDENFRPDNDVNGWAEDCYDAIATTFEQ